MPSLTCIQCPHIRRRAAEHPVPLGIREEVESLLDQPQFIGQAQPVVFCSVMPWISGAPQGPIGTEGIQQRTNKGVYIPKGERFL